MENIQIIEVEGFEGLVEHVIIDRGNGEFTSMTKAHYDSLKEAEHLNGSVDGKAL
jgi:hypothetical protein